MMASGIYGRRIIEPQISDHRQFLGDQYSIASADRKLSSDLENVWDKVSDAKAVLQKLEHRMEVTEDANKAENLAFKMTPASLPKNTPEKLSSSRAVPSVLRGSLAVKGTMQTSSKTNNHKVGFHEPLVLYHKEFEQIQAGRLASIRSPLSGTASLTSFIARYLRSNDYDVSRVTVRDKPVSVQSDMTENFSSNRTDLITDENTSPVKGTVIPPRVLNGPSKNVLNLKSKSFKPGRNLKSAGVAKTVTHFNPKEVYKYLEKEGIQKHNEKTNHRGRDDEHQAPLFLDSPHAPYKRIDIVKQKKGLQRNSEALARLKEKIQKQKERSPSSMDSSLAFGYSSTHKEDDPIVPNDSATGESKEKPRMRKIAQGPAAPKYKGFSATETKIKTPDGKVWKTGEANIPYIPTCMYPDVKKSRAVSSLFNDKKGKSKQGLTSGRLKCSLQNKAKPNQSKNLKPVRKTGKICPEDPVHKKSLITPSSWREGQKVAESILGPPPKQRKNSTEKDVQRPNSPPTRDTDLSSQKKLQSQTLSKRADIGNTKCTADASAKSNKNASANYITETGRKINEHSEFKVVDEFTDSDALVKAQPLKSGISIKASIPREKLSPSVQGILDDLHLSSSDSEEESIAALKDEQPKESAKVQRHLRGRHSHKHLLHKDSKPSNEDKASKVRHYDQNQVQQYIAKQKAERKRKQSQERKNQKEAQEKRQKQLEELYRKQKEAACMKKKIPETGKNRPVLQDTFVKSSDTPAAQAMQKINDILTEPSGWKTITTDSDKENTQEAQQPSSKFDEKMSAFMEKLNQYDVQSKTLPETEKSTPVEPIMSKDMDKRRSQAPKYSSTSEFMQKLDRYLNDEVPITSVRLSKPQRTTSYTSDNVPETQDPNLMIEDLDIHTSPGQLDSNRIFLDRYGDLSGTYGSRFTQGSSGMDPLLPAADNLTRQKSKAERIAVLKAKAESLQDRIQAESKRLMDNPVVPVQPKLEQIDSILTRSGGWSTSQQWLPETTDRQSKPQWQNTSGWDVPGIDIPDSARSRGGLDDISPSQLPGVAGLRHHVTVVEENKKETDAALKIQSAYRGHIVRLTMNSWKLPRGQSMTEVRRHATSTHNFQCNEDYDPEDDNCISEGPLSSRSDIVMSEGPELRSVEEILKEMKEKEYCIADPIPAVSTTPEWQKDIKYDDHDLGSQRNNFLADLENRLDSAKLSENFPQRSHTEESKPPWERTGGDKYSLVNVFTSKYLKALKKHGKDDNKPDVEQMRKDPLSDVAADLNVTPKQIDFLELHSISKNSDHEITDPHSSSISENISLHPENSQNSYSSITSRSPDMDANKNDISSAAHRLTSKIQASKVNYSSSDDEVRQPTYNMIPSTSEHKDDTADYNRSFNAAGTDLKKDCSSLELKGDELPSTKPFREEMHPKVFSVLGINEKKYSPAALEQRMTAELNYQEAVEESLRHLTGVERTQGVSLAQQETVSLAQLLKARQLQHEVEMERLTMKAKEEALEAEERRQKEKLKEERFQMEENIKLQKATRKSIETQAEASRLTAKAAERLSYRFANRRDYPDSLSSYSVSETITRQKDSSSSNVSDDSVALRKDIAKGKEIQRRSPSLMSEHSTTSMRPSDNDSHSSILEQLPSTEEEDTKQALQLRKEVKDKSDGSDSLQDERKTTAVDNNEGSDKSISEDLEVGDDISEVKDEDKYKKSSIDKKAPTDHPSDSSEYSVCFDESLTEDEIAEISRRVVVPSESHRRYQRRRSPHIGALDKSDISSDDQPSSVQQKTPRSTTTVRGLDDFSIGPSLSGADESEFAQFMNTMVRQYMLEEEVRSKHQAAMLKLRERAIKEKTESELAWLKQQKQQTRNKGEDDKMPPIRKKQRAILMRLKLETDEIKKLQAVGKAASHERKLFLQQHQENTLRRSKTRQPEENKDKESGMDKTRTKGGSDGQRKSSTPVPKLDIPDSPEADDVSELNSDLDVSSASSILLKKLKKHIPSKVEESRLTKREQRLFERRKQAEQLLAWKKRLDKEEKKVYDIEKQALSAWEKESDLKSNLPYYAEKLQLSARHKPEDVETQHCLKGQDLSRIDESSSGKSPNSENHSSPPPASHSESSIAEEIIQINSGTNSSRSVISSAHDDISIQRNQEESSDGTNAEDYNQSFESLNTPQQTPRSPKSQDITPQQEKLSTAENIKSAKKDMKKEPDRTGKADSPASTPLLPPYSRSDKPVTVQPGKITGQKDGSSRRKESVESWSDESFSQTQSETEHSDIECRVRALKEELKKRRFVAERLKKEQKRRHKDRLKAQEASLRSQIEAYDVFIRKTQNELTQELDHQHQLAVSNASSSSAGTHVPVAKPQIRSPRKNDQARQSARSLRSATAPSVSPEASPRSGSTRTTAVNFLNKNRTESESSGKSSRSLSFEDDEKTAEETTPNGSIKSMVGSQTSPLPSKQEKLPMSYSHTPSPTTPISDKVPAERPKRLDLTEATATLSKLTKPPSVTGSLVLVSSAQRSHIPIASKTPSTSSSSFSKLQGSHPQTAKSLIPVLVSSGSSLDTKTSVPQNQKQITSPPSPGLSESYSEDFESSAGSKKNQENGSIATEDDISEHFSDSSTATDKSDKSEALLDLSTPSKPKITDVVENKDDSLLGITDFAEAKHITADEEDEEKTPVVSPSQTPIMSPRTPTIEKESKHEISPLKFSIGDRVLLAGRESGIVRFIGETEFAKGTWVGAELELPKGKNDGSVFNIRYFTCQPKHGLFAPLDRVTLLSPVTSPSSVKTDFKESSNESELSKAISDAAKNFETFAEDLEEPIISPVEKDPGTSANRDTLAEELSNKLLNSLLQDSVTTVLDSHAMKQKKVRENIEDKEDDEQEVTAEASIDDEPLLPTPVKNFLQMLSTVPVSMEGDMEEDEDDSSVPANTKESLAETFTGDLLADTLSKVLEIRRQRAKKWSEMSAEHQSVDDEEPKHQRDLDNGREVEDILQDGKPSSRTPGKAEVDGQVTENDRDREAPVRPVSPVFGTSQDDIAEEWFDEDFGISSFHKMKPNEAEDRPEEDDIWQDGRLIEVFEPPPPVFLVPHKQQHILRLIEEAVEYYYSKHLRGELSSDVRIPDFLYNDQPDEISVTEEKDEVVDEERLESECNTNHVFKTSLFDLVRELITEIYSTKTTSEESKRQPPWLKKKTAQRPQYCRRLPKTGEELLSVVTKHVSDLLNLQGEVKKLDPKMTMKWGSRKKKDKVDLILIQELREEEPEWTNYDEDETTVKMQLTDTVLDMLLSDTVMCLEAVERKRIDRNSPDQSLHITKSAFCDGAVSSGDDRSQ